MTAHKKVTIYKDFWFRIIGSLVASELIDSIGRNDSIFRRMLSIPFYIDLLVGFMISFLLWEFVRAVVHKLDKHYDWLLQPVQRILLQLSFGVIVPALLCFLFTMIFMQVAYRQDIFQTTWLDSEFYAVILITVLINLVYFTWWLLLRYTDAQKQIGHEGVPNDSHSPADTNGLAILPIEVSKGNVKFLLRPEEISHILLEGPYTFIRTIDQQQFVTTYALDDLHKKLGEYLFFRANRQVIISRKSCQSYRSIENGKIWVEVDVVGSKPVVISQKRAKDFRKWIQGAVLSASPDILQA